jgi:hypothetical protein
MNIEQKVAKLKKIAEKKYTRFDMYWIGKCLWMEMPKDLSINEEITEDTFNWADELSQKGYVRYTIEYKGKEVLVLEDDEIEVYKQGEWELLYQKLVDKLREAKNKYEELLKQREKSIKEQEQKQKEKILKEKFGL